MYLLACLYSYAKSCLISILTYILLTKLARMASHQHKDHWSVFRRCLRLTFCTTASPWQMTGSYNLDEPLGKWFLKPCHILHGCYRSKIQFTIVMNMHVTDANNVEQPNSTTSVMKLSKNPCTSRIQQCFKYNWMDEYGSGRFSTHISPHHQTLNEW